MYQNRSHHHHGTAEGSFTAKKCFGHRASRSPSAHFIGKFFLCCIVLFFLLKLPPPARPGSTCISIYLYQNRISTKFKVQKRYFRCQTSSSVTLDTTSFSKRALRSLNSFSNHTSIAGVWEFAESFTNFCGASTLKHVNRVEKMHYTIPRLQFNVPRQTSRING